MGQNFENGAKSLNFLSASNARHYFPIFSRTKEMTRARIMRVNSRQKRVNQIRASFVKDARRQMRVDKRSLAGAY